MAVVCYQGRKNQTKEHQELSLAPITWANGKATRKGMRYATEFHVFPDYIVDTAILMTWQWRFADEYGLIGNVAGDFAYYGDSILYFEAKQSMQDFKKDFSEGKYKGLNPKGTLNWVVTPKKLVTLDMVPGNWGLLERC